MGIHEEADHILAGLLQPQLLRFEFHAGGCTVILSNASGEHRHELAPYDLLWLGIERDFLFRLMQAGTVSYFSQQEPQS